MPILSEEDDFGLDSEGEDGLLALAAAVENPAGPAQCKRALLDSESPPSKKPRKEEYPEALNTATSILKTRFGLTQFKLLQEKVVTRLIAGKSALVIFPTGGGKSLCYQLPALAIDGVTLVVSPLIALMKDQIEALQRRGIPAISFDSTKSREEYLDAQEAVRQGRTKIIYVTPERLNNEGFVDAMMQLRQRTGFGIGLMAVDESHCVSEWGHAFRPDYLKVARFAEEIRAERVVCLTATATPKVASDICRRFGIDEVSGLFKTSSYRQNLNVVVESIPSNPIPEIVVEEKLDRLTRFLRSHPGSSIVYVTLQKQAEEIARDLKAANFDAFAYHAGMDNAVRAKNQNIFMQKPNVIVVATIAFGMGIDKSDIRNVVHFEFPRSLEGYSQEIGRAGRDGHASHCLLYLCGNDWKVREGFCRGDTPRLRDVHGLLEQLQGYYIGLSVGDVLEVNCYEQSKDFDIRPAVLGSVYAQLELRFGLLRAITPKYNSYSFKEAANFALTREDRSREAEAILKGSKKAKVWTQVDVDSISRARGVDRTAIVRKLNVWNDGGCIDLRTAGVVNRYRILKELPSGDRDISALASKLHEEIKKRDEEALERSKRVIDWATSSSCLSVRLAEYFGDTLSSKKSCGHCSFCLTGKPVVFQHATRKAVDQKRLKTVMSAIPIAEKENVDAVTLARLAFGISTPRLTSLKLGRSSVFGSMDDCDFDDLVKHFTPALLW